VSVDASEIDMTTKVMVVDDSQAVREMIGQALREAGYEVVEAEDGVMGLSRLGSENDISMVLCDVNMPHMDGLEMLSAVKAGGKHATLPVFMLTTEGKVDVIKQAKQLGARGWIIKPFKREQLVALVRKVLGPC
jgi:two-component system chemotaxis response regulator CheY